MNTIGPIAGLMGAALGSFTTIKWMLLGFAGILLFWVISNNRNSKNALDARALKDLTKSAAQWNTRSVQDTNPLIALMNSNYAMAYLNVARSIGSDADIEKNTKVAVDELLKDIESAQSSAVQRLTLACPSVTPQGLAAVHTGWMSK